MLEILPALVLAVEVEVELAVPVVPDTPFFFEVCCDFDEGDEALFDEGDEALFAACINEQDAKK